MADGFIRVLEAAPDICRQLSRLPAAQGFQIAHEPDWEQALERLRNETASLVVADLRGGPGTPTRIETLAMTAGAAPLIVVAADGSVRGAVDAMRNGAFDYLVKPCSPELLNAAVQRALSGRAALSADDGSTRVGRDKAIVSADSRMEALLEMARTVAASHATVLILGESGTGKELLAAEIHRHSPRRDGPYVTMNCAALPESLAESELFGHEKGTFTGALARKLGKFELAHGGTILLDEISELPLALQAKLLRVIQEREIDRVGGTRPVAVDVRIIAISNRDLKQAVAEGRFRSDLFYRINVVPLTVPPLRQRPADIGPLVHHFLRRYAALNERPMASVAPAALDRLLAYHWPGNVRELEHTIERAVLVGTGQTLRPEFILIDDGPVPEGGADPCRLQPGMSVHDMEARLVGVTLRHVNGNRQQAADMLGISIRTLRNKLNEYKRQAEITPAAAGAGR